MVPKTLYTPTPQLSRIFYRTKARKPNIRVRTGMCHEFANEMDETKRNSMRQKECNNKQTRGKYISNWRSHYFASWGTGQIQI